ncbi:phage major capsid protein [Rhodobacterales bacterium HKCCE3408]|nr:phage major capsid protein [Rhodobacterales bacterium HKCCE3408]
MDTIEQIRAKLDEINSRAELAETLQGDLDELSKKFGKFELQQARAAARGGAHDGMTPEQREHVDLFTRHLRHRSDAGVKAELKAIEQKTAAGTSDAAGGVLVPEILLGQMFDVAKDLTAMARLATSVTVSSGDVKFPINQNNASSVWVGEGSSRSGTDEPTFIERKPTFGTVYSYVTATEELLGDSAFDVQGWLTRSVGDELALAIGTSLIAGNGSNKPTGILNTAPVADLDASPPPDDAALLYVPTGFASSFGEDPAAGGSPSLDPMGVFHDAIYSLKAQDRAAATWLMNSSTAKVIAKWRDMDGRQLLQPSLQAGMPATLLGYRVEIDEAMPDIGTNAHPVLFGDFRKAYVFAQHSSGMRITVDDNITTPGFVKIYYRTRVGGIIANQRAAVAIKCAVT